MTDYLENHESFDTQHRMYLFWESIKNEVEDTKPDPLVFKSQELPLARIKKIMKLDDDVKPMMISAEAPILFAKACEIFIREITLRAWIHTEQNRRRTLQRNDIAMAIADNDTDQFDFLIDIVPREEARPQLRRPDAPKPVNGTKVIGQLPTGMDTSGLLNGEAISAGAILQNAQGFQFLTPQQAGLINGNQQVQYILQFPPGANGAQQTLATTNGGHQQAFAIQMVQQPSFQMSTTDQQNAAAIASLPPGSIIQQGPNGTFQVIQTNPGGMILDSSTLTESHLANGNSAAENDQETKMAAANAIQNQALVGKQTFLIQQPDGTLISAENLGQQIIYTQGLNGQQQPMVISTGCDINANEEEPAEEGNSSPLTRSAAKRKAAANSKSGATMRPATKRSKPNITTSVASVVVTKIDEDSAAGSSTNPIRIEPSLVLDPSGEMGVISGENQVAGPTAVTLEVSSPAQTSASTGEDQRSASKEQQAEASATVESTQ